MSLVIIVIYLLLLVFIPSGVSTELCRSLTSKINFKNLVREGQRLAPKFCVLEDAHDLNSLL